MRDKATIVALSFYLAFAAWFAALRYQGPSFYRDIIGAWFEIGLHLTVVVALAAILVVAFTRALRKQGLPWAHLLALVGAIGVAELIWRFWIGRGSADFKLVGMVFDVGTPLIAALGVWALVLAMQKRRTAAAYSNSMIT